jgi:ketopantoate reductase
MRFAVVGAGAIGGFLGARLALAGENVTVSSHGANLEAVGRNGLRLIEEDPTVGRQEIWPHRATLFGHNTHDQSPGSHARLRQRPE